MSRHPEPLAFRRRLRRESTPAEQRIWSILRRAAFGVKFRRQHPAGRYVLDFFCREHGLAIELDGDSHYVGLGHVRDAERTRFLAARGIRVLRFTNEEVLGEIEAVIRVIREAIGARDDPE